MSTTSRLSPFIFLFLMTAITLNSTTAQAVLGEREESVTADLKAISGTRHQASDQAAYTIHEIANKHLSIREYADKNGVIFAMTWKGSSNPDLMQFMGNFFADFKQASEQAPLVRGRAPYRMLRGSQVSVVQFGHMGNLHGKMWVSDLLPQGVTGDDIQ
jgi:hypothetical protein